MFQSANILLWIALSLMVIVRQFQPRPLKSIAMIGVPALLLWGGVNGLGQVSGAAEIAFLTANGVITAALGLWRGMTFRVWTENGQAWRQGTLFTLALWGISLAARAVLMIAGHLTGLTPQSGLAELPVLLGITLGAQNLVLWLRATYREVVPA